MPDSSAASVPALDSRRSGSGRASWLILVGLAIPVFAFAAYLWVYVVNVPWFDDVETIPGTIVEFLRTPGWAGRLRWLWQPNNEHRVLYAKTVTVVGYLLTGQLNVRGLTLFSNGTLLVLLWLFAQPIRQRGLPWRYYLPVPFLLLSPQYYLSSVWTLPGLQYQPVVAFGFAGMYLLSRPSRLAFAGAFLMVLLAECTLSNGQFFWLAGLGMLLLARRWRRLACWVLATAIGFGLYFYQFPANEANHLGFQYFIAHPHESVLGFFTFLGGAFDFWPGQPIGRRAILPTAMGLGLVAWYGRWAWGLVSRAGWWGGRPVASSIDLFLVGCLLFTLLNAGVIGLLRPRFGYFVLLVSNYKLYPVVLLTLTYLTAVPRLRQQPRRLALLLAGSVLLWAWAYWQYLPDIADRRRMLLSNSLNQRYNQVGLAAMRGSDFARFTAAVMDTLSKRGIYRPPVAFYSSLEATWRRGSLPDSRIQRERIGLTLTQNSESLRFQNADYPVSTATPNDGMYVLLRSSRHLYLLATRRPAAAGRNPLRRFGPGFVLEKERIFFHPDRYQVGLVEVRGGQVDWWSTGQTLVVE